MKRSMVLFVSSLLLVSGCNSEEAELFQFQNSY
jgi:uncharacterized protein YcfL